MAGVFGGCESGSVTVGSGYVADGVGSVVVEEEEEVVTAVGVRSHFVIGDTQVSIGRQIGLKAKEEEVKVNRKGKCECIKEEEKKRKSQKVD